MLKKLLNVVKKICLAFLILYGFNLLLSSVNIIIPINIPSVATITFLGIPGFLMLVAMYFII